MAESDSTSGSGRPGPGSGVRPGIPGIAGGLLPRPRQLDLPGPAVPFRPPIVRLDASLPPQGYRIDIGQDGLVMWVADDAGAFYGRATLEQLRRASEPGTVPAGQVTDWPDLPVRGVMLDISRDKVPTLATLQALVDRLASWKINQLQLYTEHTFPYAGHEDVWRDASPVPPEDILALDTFCRERHVELVPNQNTLGHFERWLRHPRYLPLAASPDGWRTRDGRQREPMTLDPASQHARDLVQDLLGQLLPWFSSRRVNAGLDEPWELGDGRATEWSGWLAWLRGLPELTGRELLVWGDVLAGHAGLLGQVPPRVTVCEWGYEADHPFGARAEALAAAGVPFYLCPGTSSWNSIIGRLSNAVGNCAAAADAAARHGALGYLVTDWGDGGHLQYQPVAEAALGYAAGVAWHAEANRGMDLAQVLDRVVFDDPAGQLGTAVVALGDAYLALPANPRNASGLTRHLWRPDEPVTEAAAGQTTLRDGFATARERIAAALEQLGRARSARTDAGLVTAELQAGGELTALLCDDAIARLGGDGTLAGLPAGVRDGFARTAADLAGRHRELWLARNRPGGLADSARRLDTLVQAYQQGT
jgi:hypothetical protein